MSVSSAERISSGLMSGEVFATGIVAPDLSAGPCAPGSSSTNMSLRPVRGRRRADASGWSGIFFGHFLSSSIVTTAAPFLRSTPVILPTCTPAIRTDWPWPGVTACPVEKTALRMNAFDSMKGIRGRASWLAMM